MYCFLMSFPLKYFAYNELFLSPGIYEMIVVFIYFGLIFVDVLISECVGQVTKSMEFLVYSP